MCGKCLQSRDTPEILIADVTKQDKIVAVSTYSRSNKIIG